ncbi:MAG: hypothetical protein JWM44_3596 [Bacilli bacterium]|nr:hypothetical protein [Bacilli bacterium]
MTDKNKTHKGKPSTGMEENVAGLLCYVLGKLFKLPVIGDIAEKQASTFQI